MQLRVVKSDGTAESYMHTKVMGAINNALTVADRHDTAIAESLAEVVTHFVHHKYGKRTVTSSEIFSIIKAALSTANLHDSAIALNDHHYQRKLKRGRIEVVSIDLCELVDASLLYDADELIKTRWNKSVITADLIANYNLTRQTAQTIASMVEEKILGLKITKVPLSLIKQLVLADTAAILKAQSKLQNA